MAKIWSSHDPSNWFYLNFNQCAKGCPNQISHLWVYPISPFPRNGQNIAHLWPIHGPHMVLKICSSWMLVIVPRDVPCHISHWWVYSLASFPRNGQNIALYGQNMVLKWSLKLVLSEPESLCPGLFHARFHIAGCIIKPPFLEMDKTWPFYGQNMVLTWSFQLVLPESYSLCPVIFHAKFHIAGWTL